MKRSTATWLALLLLIPVGCRSSTQVPAAPRTLVQTTTSSAGMVVSDSVHASRVGADVLAEGGNAVDAAVATAFALAVTWPEAGNLGGGGFMLIAQPDSKPDTQPDTRPRFIDYREVAPAAATVDMYTPGENRHHPRHVGVPGTVAGLALAHQELGTMPWRDLVLPAVALARDGFLVDEHLAGSINRVLADDSPALAELRRVYGKDEPWQAGDTLKLPDLARTLQRIADEGPAGFYSGPTAERLAGYMADNGGLITAEDLANYAAVERPATHATYRGFDIWGASPPSSGGVTVALALGMLEPLALRESERFGADTLHLMAESLRRAFHQRALHLGDPDFGEVPTERLLEPSTATALGKNIDPAAATPSATLEPALPLTPESPDTTHFSVIDGAGLSVANTYTLEQSWGSRMIAPGTGVVLNNEMGDFNWVPDRTTSSGAIGTPANVIEPGKRMLSSMTPTIVTRDGKPVIITGSPGGRTIISTVLCVLVNRLEFELSPAESVQAPRMHHQWLPDRVVLEKEGTFPTQSLIAELEALGHTVHVVNGQGSAHSIFIDDAGTATGVADHRRGGAAVAPRR